MARTDEYSTIHLTMQQHEALTELLDVMELAGKLDREPYIREVAAMLRTIP